MYHVINPTNVTTCWQLKLQMLLLACLLAASVLHALSFNVTQYRQTDYIVFPERAELVCSNKAFIVNPLLKNFKFNRTHFAMNISMTFVVDLNDTMRVDVQGYKFASNEYRFFPLTFGYNFCEAFGINLFGFKNLFNNCGKMFTCPMIKGSYSVCNWMPDYTQFPPYIPRGRYMLDISWKYFKTEIFHGQWYMAVKDAKAF